MKKIRKLIAGVLTAVFLVSAGIVLLGANAPPASVDATSVDDGSTALLQDGSTIFAAASLDDGFNSSVLSKDGSAAFAVERIKWSGRSDSASIVMVLMGDGFLANQQGTLPNPAEGTFLHQAKSGVDFMMDFHPFDLFADIFTVYAIKVVSAQEGITTDIYDNVKQTYFGSYYNNGPCLSSDGIIEARRLAGSVVGGIENVDMIQVISNCSTEFGHAYATRPSADDPNPNIGVVISGKGGIKTLRTFVHESAHAFGFLSDECSKQYSLTTADAPNRDTGTADETNIKWKHWLGHGDNEVRQGYEPSGFIARDKIGIYAPSTSQTGDPNSPARLKRPVNGTCIMT